MKNRLWEHMRIGPMTGGAKRGLLYLVGLCLLSNLGVYILSARSVHNLATQQHSECRFYDDLGSAPIAVINGKASILGVEIVSDARVAWHEGGCPGAQLPPDPTFLHWADYYHLPVN